MRWRIYAVALAILLVTPCMADTYTVNTHTDGVIRMGNMYTLRWAIEKANAHQGPDEIVFTKPMRITPESPLPALTDAGTTIDGDVNDDGIHDVVLDGRKLTEGHGIQISVPRGVRPSPFPRKGPMGIGGKYSKLRETIRGLAFVNFPGSGLYVNGRDDIWVTACSFGWDGERRNGQPHLMPNGEHDIYMIGADRISIGGNSAEYSNFFLCLGDGHSSGVYLENCTDARIHGNEFGLGTAPAPDAPDRVGVKISRGSGNAVGSHRKGEGNTFAGLTTGVRISASKDNVVAGNQFGEGNTLRLITYSDVILTASASHNTIGGTAAGAGNTFGGGGEAGITVEGAGTESNEILGNYFGVAPDGTRLKAAQVGVQAFGDAGSLRVGTHVPTTRNYFCLLEGSGVDLAGGGQGSIIENNCFGKTPSGGRVRMPHGVTVRGVRADLLANEFVITEEGILLDREGSFAHIHRNHFTHCDCGVHIANGASANLGDLGNRNILDEGGNVFFAGGGFTNIRVTTAGDIKAEGNDFGETVAGVIDMRIYDGRDRPGYGIVDYDPLIGGVHPE